MNEISDHFSQLEGPVCLMALSGIGKTHLTGLFPNLIVDTDRALDKATKPQWPHLSAYNRRRAWREFCSNEPWNNGEGNFLIWSAIRREYTSLLNEHFDQEGDCLILTSEFIFPQRVDLYVGVDLGKYEEHLNIVAKVTDNGQSESMNNRLEGYSPLIRIQPGTHLSDTEPVREWLRKRS